MAETATLKVGDPAPDFELPSSPTGDRFKLSDNQGKNAVVINFLPAAFSPVCSNQLDVLQQKLQEFQSQDAIPVAISTDGPWALKAWKEHHNLDYPVLSDGQPKGKIANEYGVYIEQYGVANRVTIVVDKDGKVAWIEPSAQIGSLPDYDPVLSCLKS